MGTLIEMTTAEDDPQSATPERLRLDTLLREVVEDCRLEADGLGCGIALRVGEPLTVLGNPELLRRAVENVVRNSIRYAPPKSTVEVDLEAVGSAAGISVRDYGPGVPEEALPKMFQAFFRVDDSRASSTGGIGLGLAIAMRAVCLHHGRLWAQNAHPGLRVSIKLPVAAP